MVTTSLRFGERRAILPPFDKQQGKKTVYEGGVHVPLIVKGPVVTAPEIKRDQLVHVVDLFPTIAELAGVHFEHKIDGVSFAPALRNPKTGGRSVVYSDRQKNGSPPYPRESRMIRNRDWKLIRLDWNRGLPDAREEEEFFAMGPGQLYEGPNLLQGPLAPDAKSAYQFLAGELDRITASLTYEGATPGPGQSTPQSGE